jgi:hypothetical protein
MRTIPSRLMLRSLAAGLALLLISPARAQLSLALDPPLLLSTPGSVLTFSGTLTNTGTGELFLSGDSFTLAGAGLSLDDTPFLEGAPLSLPGGQSFAGALFTVSIAQGTPNGSYGGSFTVLGGPAEGDQGELATARFTAQVVPEPGTLALAAVGLLLPLTSAFTQRRRRSEPAAPTCAKAHPDGAGPGTPWGSAGKYVG